MINLLTFVVKQSIAFRNPIICALSQRYIRVSPSSTLRGSSSVDRRGHEYNISLAVLGSGLLLNVSVAISNIEDTI